MDLILLGASNSGKDTIASALGWENRKFARFAKDWVDDIFGGSFESDRYRPIGDGFTKDNVMIALFHALKDFQASVHFARNNWEFGDGDRCYTDVRTTFELEFLMGECSPVLIYLPDGTFKSSDKDVLKVLELARDRIPVITWGFAHPAQYPTDRLRKIVYNLLSIHRSQ